MIPRWKTLKIPQITNDDTKMNTIKNDDANEHEYHWIYHWRYQERIPSEEGYHWYKWRLKPLIIPRKMISYQVKMNTKDTNEDSNH